MWKEFRDFITKGNLLQLAVAFIMGVAFATLVKSFIEDIIMPLIGKAAGNVDFANLYVNLSGQAYESANAAREVGAAAIYYGAFVNNFVNFLLIAFVVLLLVRGYVRMQSQKRSDHRQRRIAPVAGRQSPSRQRAVPIAPLSSVPERIARTVLLKGTSLALRATW